MRNSFDGLSGIVRNELIIDPLCGDVFVFINKRRNCIKLLQWEESGFVLYYKRLEKGTFEMPVKEKINSKSYNITWSSLMLITQGISLKHIHLRKRFHFEKTKIDTDINIYSGVINR
jgi:hypothetical protein